MNTQPVPNEEQIERLLSSIQPKPGERFYRRMASAPWRQQQQRMNSLADTGKLAKASLTRLRLAATIALMILLITVLIFITPQGRAWAHNTLRFFTRTASNTLPATPYPTAEIILVDVPPGVSFTPKPTPTSNLQTLLPFYNECGSWSSPTCTVEQIRGMVDFQVKELARIPDGMHLIGATGGPDGVSIHYQRDDMTGGILLSQGPWTEDVAEAWKVALTATVETVPIGNVTGEYVKGLWSMSPGDAVSTWDPTVEIQTLRWRERDMFYTMMVTGSPEDQGQPLSKDGMVDLAADLTTQNVVIVPDTTLLKTVQEADALAGFDVVEPSQLPEDFTFSRAAYSTEKNTVCLFYQYKGQDESFAPPLTLIQSSTPLPGFRDLPDPLYEEMHIDPTLYVVTQTIAVEGAVGGRGVYLDGGDISIGSLCGVLRMPYERGLIWQAAQGRYFALFYNTDVWVGTGYLTRLEMLKVVENLNGVAAIPSYVIDPERLHSIQEAETLAGFDVKGPSKLPKGYSFDHAAYNVDGQIRTVNLIYIHRDEMGGGYTGFSISTSIGVTKTLEMVDDEAHGLYKKLSVNDQPALYLQGCGTVQGWDWSCSGGLSLTWFDDGIEYSIWAIVGDLNEETAIAIAESMR